MPARGTVDPSSGSSQAKLQAESRTEQSSRRPVMSIDQRFSAMVRAPSPRPVLSIPPKRSTRERSAGSSSSEAVVGSVRSFTVKTEAGGKKNLSETEISHLVRSSIQKARRNAKNKGRKSQDQLSIQASQVLMMDSPAAGASSPSEAAAAAGASPSEAAAAAAADTSSGVQRKFSWSSVEEDESDSEDDNKEPRPDESFRKSSTVPEQRPLPRAWPRGGFFRGFSDRVGGETGDERTGPLEGAKLDNESRIEKVEVRVIGGPAKDDCEKLKETESNSEEHSRRSSLQNSISRAKMARDEITELLNDEQVEAVISACASDIPSAMSGLSVNSDDKDAGIILHSSLDQSKVGNNGLQLDDGECVEGMSRMPMMSQSNVNSIVADTMRRAKEAAKNNLEETKIPASPKNGTDSTAESPKSLRKMDEPTTDESKDKAATPEFKNWETPRSPKSAEIFQTVEESMNHQPSVKSPPLSLQKQERPPPDVTKEPVPSPRTLKSPKSPPAHPVAAEDSPESANTTTKVATESALAEAVGSATTETRRKTIEPNTIASPRASKSRVKMFASLSIELKESLANLDEMSLASSPRSPVKSSAQAADSEAKRISSPVDLDFTKHFSSAMTRAQGRRLSGLQQKEESVEPAAPLAGAELSIDPPEKVSNDITSQRLAGAADVTIAGDAVACESPNDKYDKSSADESIDALDDAVAGESEKSQPNDKSRADESIVALGDDVTGEADASLPEDKSGKTRLGILQNTLGETQGDSAEYGLEVALVSTSETSSSSENNAVDSPESSTKEEESADQDLRTRRMAQIGVRSKRLLSLRIIPDSSIPGEDASSDEVVLSEKGDDAVESATKEVTFESEEKKKAIPKIPESDPDGKELETTAPAPLTSSDTHEGTKKGLPLSPKSALLHASPRGSGESLPTSPTSNVSAVLEKRNVRKPTPTANEATETIGSHDISAASQNGAGRQLLTLKESPSSDDEFVGKTILSPLVPSDSTSQQAGKYSKLRAKKKKKKKRVKRRSRENREDRSLPTPNPGETVIKVTEEFLAEIASRKGSTLTAEELNRLLNAVTPAKIPPVASEATKESLLADDHVADEVDRAVSPIGSSPRSRESRTSRASSRKSRESRPSRVSSRKSRESRPSRANSLSRSRASSRTHMTKSHHTAPFCMDFLWHFGFHDDNDVDLLEDDSMSFSLSGSLDDDVSEDYNDETTIGADDTFDKNSTNYGTGASNSFESRGRGGSPFYAESPQTLTENERRRVTFSFSEGRSTSDNYDGSYTSDSSTRKNW